MSPSGSARVSHHTQRKIGEIEAFHEEGIKLFVDGLEANMDFKQLRKIFEKYGEVISAFVPSHLKRGRRVKFGFVFFKQRKDGLSAMWALHGKKLYNTYLSVNPARFIDSGLKWNVPKAPYKDKPKNRGMKQVWRKKENMMREGKGKTRQVWRVKEKPKSAEPETQMKPEVVVLNKNMSRLVSVTTPEVLCCDDIKLWLNQNGFSKFLVKHFGAKEKILEFVSLEERQIFMETFEGKESLFLSLKPMEVAQQPRDYLIWIKIWKIPIGLWSVDFISKIASRLGSVVCIDEITRKGLRYDVARALISVPDPIIENQIIPITVGSVETNVLVEIDYICDENIDQVRDLKDRDNVDNESSKYCSEVEMCLETTGVDESGMLEYASPAVESGSVGDAGGIREVVQSMGLIEENDEQFLVSGVVADTRFEFTNGDRTCHLIWSVNNDQINWEINGRCANSFINLIRISIPTTVFNFLVYGYNLPFHPLEMVRPGPPELGLNSWKVVQNEQHANKGNDIVLLEIEDTPFDSSVCITKCEVNNSKPCEVYAQNEDCSSHGDEEEILKKAKQGISRTSKLKSLENLATECARPGHIKQKRGRKPKAIFGPSILREISEGLGGVDPNFVRLQESAAREGASPYFTRATKVWLLGKSVGLSYPGSDEEATRGLAEELAEDHAIPPSI